MGSLTSSHRKDSLLKDGKSGSNSATPSATFKIPQRSVALLGPARANISWRSRGLHMLAKQAAPSSGLAVELKIELDCDSEFDIIV